MERGSHRLRGGVGRPPHGPVGFARGKHQGGMVEGPPGHFRRLGASDALRAAAFVVEVRVLAIGRHETNSSRSGLWLRTDQDRLNESLAVWMELHYARDDEDLREIVMRYSGAGQYPGWPYAGAFEIEAQYQARGVEAVREWIERLRNDPAGAVSAFDLAVGCRASVASAS